MASLFAQSRGVFCAARSGMAPRAVGCIRPVSSGTMGTVAIPSQQSSSFLGGSSLGAGLVRVAPTRGSLVVVANAKKSLACTKEGTNRKRVRVSGFRTRMASKNGRKVLKARMKKGRHVLCKASMKKSGGKK